MQKSKEEDEISPQLSKPARKTVQSKLFFSKNAADKVEKEKEKEITVGMSQFAEKDVSSPQLNLSCVKPLVDHQDATLLFLDEEEKRKTCQPNLPWHKPPFEEEKTAEPEERGQPEESSGKRRNFQKRTLQMSPLKTNQEECQSSARVKRKNNSNSQQLENKQKTGKDHPEIHLDNGDTELGGSSSRKTPIKTPKRTPKKTPKRTPKRTPKEKKIGTTKGACSQNMDTSYQVTDLRLEAKLAAEENARLFAGKQTHPFFTSRKLAKKAPEIHIVKKETKCWPGLDGGYTVSCPAIHVIDSIEDGFTSFDWKNWVFIDTSFIKPNGYPTTENALSVLDGIIKPLNVDDLPRKTVHLNQKVKHVQQSFMDLERLPSASDKLLFDSLKNKQPDMERLTSYYQRISCWPECSLWTTKYQPENALEVCGNSESVLFLCEWLKAWDEKSLQSSKLKQVLEPCLDSDDSAYDESDMDDEVNLKNVLLIKGPVGSGKSAAIYACAKEQGYEVIEVNTSDLRNGAQMKQAFGQAMDSHALNKWSVEGPTVSKRKLNFDLFPSQTVIGEDDDLGSGSLETSSSSCKQDLANEDKLSWDAYGKNSACHTTNKSLILFEDVDTVFDADRGFLLSILHLAETAKRPIILTSNCKNPVLPTLLDYDVLDFVLPSKEELLSHLSMICASEKVNISSDLLEHLIRCCVGDIRKTLMLLQFWCQGKKFQIDKASKCSCNPLAFDIDAAYLITPRMISWELKCMLSEKVADEIDRAIAIIEEKKIEKMEAMLEEFSAMQMIKNHSRKRKVPKTPVKAKKKKTLLKSNSSVPDSAELSDQANDLKDIYDFFDSPKQCVHKTAMSQTGIVISSQSENLSDGGEHPCISQTRDILPFDLNLSYQGDMHDTGSQPSENFETASASHICDTYISQDVSHAPESCFMDGFLDISSQNTSVSLAIPILSPEKNNSAKFDIDLNKCFEDNFENTFDRDVEQVNGNEEAEENSQKEFLFSSCHSQLMDECSRANFDINLMASTAAKISDEVDLVEETWKKLRVGHHDLKPLVAANSKDAYLALKHVSALTDLICEADIMFKSCYCHNNDILEPSMVPSIEPDVSSFYEQQVEMGSVYAQHGLCYHAINIAEVGYNLGHTITKDLAHEMLNSSINTMALGRLLSKGNTSLIKSCSEGNERATKSICRVPTTRKLEAELYNAMLTTVPARLSMVLRNSAFHDYASYYSKISKLEHVRLSQSVIEKRRRSRTPRHYLSSGSFAMSDEHVQLLAQVNCFNQPIKEVGQQTINSD